jgi:hypothetical protein
LVSNRDNTKPLKWCICNPRFHRTGKNKFLIKLFPEVEKAQKQVGQWQAESWLDLDFEICGLPIRQMCLRDYFVLHGIGSPFIHSEDFTPEDIAIFLWVLSPEFVPCKMARKDFFKKAIKVKIIDAVDEIAKFMEMTFADADTTEGEGASKFANFLTYQIDLLAKEYGWQIDYILNLPLRQIFQLNSAIGERYAKQSGEKFQKMRSVDLMQAQMFFDKQKNKSDSSILN